jgi:lipoprotein NlpD
MTSRLVTIICLFMLLASCGGASRWQDAPQTHIVRKGETLFSISWRYGKDPSDLARWNRLGDGSLIYPGQVIRLMPTSGPATGTSTRKSSTTTRNRRPLPDIPAQPSPKWSWPTNINAAASGRVVYAGGGLIGYGKLIILKHNETYLSAYGYNASLLVKEGEQVKQGQRIATMGEGPERKPRLHFEIRRNGQPVNPRQHLPTR